MRLTLLCPLFLALSWSLPAHAQQSQWYRLAVPGYPAGGAGTQITASVVRRDAAGNFLHSFTFKDSATFMGVHLVSSPSADHFDFALFKLSPSGQLLWHWQAGGSGGNRRFIDAEFTTDPAQNIILCGRLRGGTLIAGTTSLPSLATGSGLFLIKISPNGQVQWAQKFIDALSSSGESNITNSLTTDHAGNILIPGHYYGEITLAGQPVSIAGNANAFLAKIAPDGSRVWTKVGGGGNTMKGGWVCVDFDDNLYFSGSYVAQGTFGGVNLGIPSAYRQQNFLMKITPAGQILWTQQFGTATLPGSALDRLVFHPSGDLLLRLRADGTAFGVALSGNSNVDMMRISPAGVARWVRPVPLRAATYYNCDATGNIYFSTFYENTPSYPAPALGNNIPLPVSPPGGACGVVAAFDENLRAQWAASARFTYTGGFGGPTSVLPTGQIGVLGGYGLEAIIGTDTLRSKPYTGSGVSNRANYAFVWSFNAPLGFGVAPEPRRIVCPGTSFRLPFIAQAGRFAATNVFRAELSDSTGYFGFPQVIGSLVGAGTGADSITLTIPASLPTGGKYQVRIVSTSPAMVSAGDGLALEIRPGALTRILAPDTVGACPGQLLPLLRARASYGSQLQWLRDGLPLPGALADSLRPTQPGRYTVRSSGAFCGPATSRPVQVQAFAAPTVTLTPFGQVLLTAPALPLSGGSPAGGTWSGPGVTNGTFSPSAAGVGTHLLTYTYTSRFGCSATATQSLEVVRTLGLAETAGVRSLSLSPNPASGAVLLTFSTARAQAPRVQLIDALGRVVREQPLPIATEHVIPLALPAASGVYRVRLLLADGVIIRPLLVQP